MSLQLIADQKRKVMKRHLKLIITITLGLVLLIGGVQAQELINYLPEAAKARMTDSQKHFYEKAMDSPFAKGAVLATINIKMFEENTVVFNYKGVPYTANKMMHRSGVPSATRISWIGQLDGWNGQAHIVYRKSENMVVGMIEAEHTTFLIRPLGDGLHAIVDWDMTMEEGCQVPDGRGFEYRGSNPAVKGSDYDHPDIIAANAGSSNGGRATGECNVRVLVAYTDDVDANVADILMDVNNMVNLANTGYENSEAAPGGAISMRVELAVAYEVAYAETGNMDTDLDCITNTSDGCLDDIHTQRNLWKADQCVLLTDFGSGLAWVSTDFEDQFSVTGRGNFYAHTFHHEMGHNAECTHALNQSAQPGTAPYAGYGEPTTGCFRTVLAYGDACGTGGCPRQNIFSDDDSGQWTCGGDDYTPGTSSTRNQDRLDLSGPILVAHNTVSASVTYGSDYDWNVREAVHFAASSDVSYSSATNNFELFSGAEGSFRAANSVTLGPGFWAKSGSEFTAYLENCATLNRLSSDEEQPQDDKSSLIDETAEQLEVEIYPNPFDQSTTLKYYLSKDSEVYLLMSDILGRSQKTLIQKSTRTSGWHTVDISGNDLAAGVYHVTLMVDDQSVVRKIIKVSRQFDILTISHLIT